MACKFLTLIIIIGIGIKILIASSFKILSILFFKKQMFSNSKNSANLDSNIDVLQIHQVSPAILNLWQKKKKYANISLMKL